MTKVSFAFQKKERGAAKGESLWSTRPRAVSERHQNWDSAVNTINRSGFRAANIFSTGKRKEQPAFGHQLSCRRFWTKADWSGLKTGVGGGSNNHKNSYFLGRLNTGNEASKGWQQCTQAVISLFLQTRFADKEKLLINGSIKLPPTQFVSLGKPTAQSGRTPLVLGQKSAPGQALFQPCFLQ